MSTGSVTANALLAAQSGSGGSSASLLIFLLPLALIGFMVWSQRKRQRQVASVQESLSVGDEVCTTSGLFGTVTALDERVATLEVAPGVRLRYDRRAVGLKVAATDAPAVTEPGE